MSGAEVKEHNSINLLPQLQCCVVHFGPQRVAETFQKQLVIGLAELAQKFPRLQVGIKFLHPSGASFISRDAI